MGKKAVTLLHFQHPIVSKLGHLDYRYALARVDVNAVS